MSYKIYIVLLWGIVRVTILDHVLDAETAEARAISKWNLSAEVLEQDIGLGHWG